MVTRNSVLIATSVLCFVSFTSSARNNQSVLGMRCAFDSDCRPIRNSYCREDVCECRLSFVSSGNKDRCLPRVTLPGDSCEEDVQCALDGGASSCRANTCLRCNASSLEEYSNCDDPYGCVYHEYNNRCWRNRDIGQECSNSEECWMYPTSNLTRTCDGDCICTKNFMFSPKPNPGGVDMCLDVPNIGYSSNLADNKWGIILATVVSVVVTTKIL